MNELWKMKCKADLFNLRRQEAALQSMPEEIAMERERMVTIKSAMGGSGVQGGGMSNDEKLNNSICLIDLLSDNLQYTTTEVNLTRKALSTLTEEEQRILSVLYIDRQRGGAGILCEELNCDERTIWRKAARALEGYNTARHGKN